MRRFYQPKMPKRGELERNAIDYSADYLQQVGVRPTKSEEEIRLVRDSPTSKQQPLKE